jgi:kynurenine formamidase
MLPLESGGPVEIRGGPAPAGALARIRQERLLSCLRRVRVGRVYDLGGELSYRMPQGSREIFCNFRISPYRTPVYLRNREHMGFDFMMEAITGSPHLGSHIDGFAHVQQGGTMYGGISVTEAYGDTGWKQLGMETVSPILGRGILLDVARALETEQLPDLFEIMPDHVQLTLRQQGTELEQGDIVLVRTGKFREFVANRDSYMDKQPGVGVDAGIWLYDRGMAVLGVDTSATEPSPFKNPGNTTHRAMLIERGVHILEILNLEVLAADQAYEFFFVCLPLKIVGATGSWVRPIGIV